MSKLDHLPHETFDAPHGFSVTGVQSMRSHVVFAYKREGATIEATLTVEEADRLATAVQNAAAFAGAYTADQLMKKARSKI